MVDAYADARLVSLYDVLNPWGPSDDFYLDLVMSASSVLDVGCGTGTLLRRARDSGHEGRLCGVDPAEGMLDQARRHPDVEWVLGDLSSVSGPFDLVVMTGHVFQVFLTDDDIRGTLAGVRRMLGEGGRFAFETRNPAFRAWERWTPEHGVTVTGADGADVRVEHAVETPVEGHLVRFATTFSSPAWDAPEVSPSTLRFVDATALSCFLSEAGLAVLGQYGDWDRRPFGDASPEIITIAAPASR
ncbi:class I SAM-dependent methyltransferase [Nonomuraea mangrovi]|uniref:Class I SAM-dependent methyltransferase n=1 Tax=Nonomuraea mangrovi TaxID=2316207 RepID=A0ABW4SSV1_9ACTN